jgi:hypothetical protein
MREIFLCKTTKSDLKWYLATSIPPNVLQIFKDRNNSNEIKMSYNTDKSKFLSCDLKCRTRGLQLACMNCGIILVYKELYGSESCTQVALMYLQICANFSGKLFL